MKAALIYARELGWRVVPLHSVDADGACSCGGEHLRADGTPDGSAGKHPRLNNWTKEASSDPSKIEEWIASFPDANLGVCTGDLFFVLDVDPRHGGNDSLAELIETHGELPTTVQATTPSGGSHYLFKMPAHAVTNSAGKIGDGLDIRGTGGQIVVAPSRTAVGQYRWVNAPWKTEIAEAPAWLLEELGRTPAKSTTANTERGYFPPASAQVIEEARAALEAHGPAIDGQGGGLHTVQAGSLLTHDFALTDEEAWPLLLEWNETCQPPWEEDDLRERLRRGRKYGKLDYGCKRTADAHAAATKLLRDFELATDPDPYKLVEQIKELAKRCSDMQVQGLAGDIKRLTGLKVKLPHAQPKIEKPTDAIEVVPRIHEVADKAIASIEPHVFHRNGVLCEVVTAGRTFISDLEPARVLDLMSKSSDYFRPDGDGILRITPPAPVASILHARRSHPVRQIESVTTAPILLADGTVLCEKGYNAEAKVWLEPSVEVDVPENPTREDAQRAVLLFRDLLCDYKFADQKADFSAWLAALLSPLVKAATGNAPTPLICVSASSPGAGKSMLVDLIARIVTGTSAEIRTYNTRDATEWNKKLTTFVRMASPVSVFDNCNGAIGDEGLDRLITSSTWSDRILGASDAPPLPNVTTWLATGNNIEPVGDTVRRVLMIRIEVDTEKPQERTGFKRPLLVEYATEHRAELLTAALTILRAYCVAGRPSMSLPTWGSFVAWSELVRGAIRWTGLKDPFATQQRCAAELNEPENDAHDFWIDVVGDSDGSAADVTAKANSRDAQGVLGLRESITPIFLKRFIGRFVDKPRAGKRIRREAGRYWVEEIRATSPA